MIHQDNAKSAGSSAAIVPFHFDNISVSWAGEGRSDGEFCFGTEDGQLRFTTVDGTPTERLDRSEDAPEAVNGAAFVGSVTGISNRREIFFRVPVPGRIEAERLVFPYGAHGLIATADGDFVAPLGRTGLLMARTSHDGPRRFLVSRIPQQTMDYYRVIDLHSSGRPDMLACAMRHSGIAATELVPEGEKSQIRSLTFPGLDVVDVCSLGVGANPPAIAALDKGGTLILLRDAINDPSPVSMGFDSVTGTAYRVLCARGNILILTSTGLHVLTGLARGFLAGEPVESTPTTVRTFPLEAVDANVCWDRWILVVLSDGVLRFDLERLTESLPTGEPVQAEPTSSNPVPIAPAWEFHHEFMTAST